jgi:hypothetical protein
MKAILISILSLIFLSGSIAAEADIDSGIQTKRNRNLRTPEINLSNSSQETRGTQENCGLTIEVSH